MSIFSINAMLDCCLLMFMKIFIKAKICLILVNIHQIQSFLTQLIKKVIGKLKDEFKGKIISEFVGLKSKMYSLISVDDEEITKAKGVNKKIKHKEFVDVLVQ